MSKLEPIENEIINSKEGKKVEGGEKG